MIYNCLGDGSKKKAFVVLVDSVSMDGKRKAMTYKEYHIVQGECHNHSFDRYHHMDRHVQIKELMMEVMEVDIHHACKYHEWNFDGYIPSIVRFERRKQVVNCLV